MKPQRILILLTLFCLPILVAAQSNSLFERYRNKEMVNSVYISKAMMEMSPELFKEDPIIGGIVGKLNVVKILSTRILDITQDIRKDFNKLVSQSQYELLIQQKENNNYSITEIYIERNGNKIKNLLMLVIERMSDLKYICLQGDLTLKDIRKIINSQEVQKDGKEVGIKDFRFKDSNRMMKNIDRMMKNTNRMIKNIDTSLALIDLPSIEELDFDKDMQAFDKEMQAFDEDMKAFDKEMKAFDKEMKRLSKKQKTSRRTNYRIN